MTTLLSRLKTKSDLQSENAEGKPVEGDGFTGKVLEFGKVDQKFIDFISDEIQDYDNSKN
ncbi:MAG: hypothetical protein JWM21_293 [Acidobacteria bacterium]|nr:hypothetical protein [Acidobacteriota bacterium]